MPFGLVVWMVVWIGGARPKQFDLVHLGLDVAI